MDTRRLSPTPAIPVVEQIAVALPMDEQARLGALAARIAAAEPALAFTGPFGAGVAVGTLPVPSVVIEDHSAIALHDRWDAAAYDYRVLALAGEGDMAVIGARRDPAFEGYCRDRLGLGRVTVKVAAVVPRARSLTLRAVQDPALIDSLAVRARQAGGLNIVPYMASGGVWALAARIAAAAGRPVRVAAPPPRLAARTNDKAWFTARVADVLGRRAAPPSAAVHSLAALTVCVGRFAADHSTVAVKLVDSASSSGNVLFAAAQIAGLPPRRLRALLHDRLRAMGWPGSFPLLVTAWEHPVLASPSVQLWIPDRRDGGPVVEGIFDQIVAGPTAVFAGAVPSTLPTSMRLRAAGEAARLGWLLQALGFFGRCSFDAVLVGRDASASALHWVECNGRWGGVSIPLTLANRLCGDWTAAALVIVDRIGLDGRPRPFAQALQGLGDQLYRAGGPTSGAVLLAPSRLERGSGYQALVLDHTADAAMLRGQRLEAAILRLLELNSGPAVDA